MLAEERQVQILDYIEENGAAEVGDLGRQFGVSEVTIRRDLQQLAADDLIRRVWGGAIAHDRSTSSEPSYDLKKGLNLDEKARIGRIAANLVGDGQAVILDSGTTTWHVAKCLTSRTSLTVITTDLIIAMALGKDPPNRVVLIGGTVRPGLFCCIGHDAEKTLADLTVDISFLGADAISVQRGITNATLEEVPIKIATISAGRQVVLVADHTKFEKEAALAKVADLGEVDCVITGHESDPAVIEAIEEKGVRVLLA